MPAKHVVSGAVAVAMLSVCMGCGDDKGQATTVADDTVEVVPSTSGCARSQTETLQDGDVGVVSSLEDIGRSDGAVLVVDVAPGNPVVGLNEDPSSGANFPHVITRYAATVKQLVIWPDSVPTPAVGEEMTLDVQGGTMGCFTLIVTPDPATLDPGGEYL